MGALAIPLLEGAGEAITAAWSAFVSSGATATAGGAATAAVLALPGDKATDKDKAKAQANTRTREQRCKCPPEKGIMGPVNHYMSDLSAEYQRYVTNFAIGEEWIFLETDFDGFSKAQCLLQETKARYDQFFNPKTGKPKFFFLIGKSENTPGVPNKMPGWKGILNQATRQSNIVLENQPARMRWYFMQPLLYGYAISEFAKRALAVSTEYKPMPVKEGME